MPDIDILTLVKDIIRFIKVFRPKLAVVKHCRGDECNSASVIVTNLTNDPITVLDVGFFFHGTHFTVDDTLFQPLSDRVEFPQTIKPRTPLSIRIGPGAFDVWKDADVYVTGLDRRRKLYKVKPHFAAAR